MKVNVVSRRQGTKRQSIILIAVGKIDNRNTSHESAGEQDHTQACCFGIRDASQGMSGMKIKKNKHGSAHAPQVHLARHGIDGQLIDLDTQISYALVERSVRCQWDDPERPFTLIYHQRENEKRSHFRLSHALDVPRPIFVHLDGHDDRLGTTGCYHASAIGIVKALGHDLGLHLANRREDVQVERIRDRVVFEHSSNRLGEIITLV